MFKSLPICSVWFAGVLAAVVGLANAQDGDVAELVTGAVTAMNENRWEEALADLTEVTKAHEATALKVYGPPFGVVWYRRGVCEMQLKRWKEAMRSFETCYQGYPNTPSLAGNLFHKKALLRWSEAAVGAGEWDLAIRLSEKFLDERDRQADPFPQGVFHVNLAVCHYKLGDIRSGNEHLEIAIRNKEVFPTADVSIVTGLQELLAVAIEQRNEQALLDFLLKNRADIILPPADACAYSANYLTSAGHALAAGFHRAALVFYGFVPDDEVAMDDLRACLASLGDRPALVDGMRLKDRQAMQQRLAGLEEARREGRSASLFKLAGMAVIQEKLGNLSGSRAAYEQLERFYPAAKAREEHLFHLIRTAASIGLASDARKEAEKFAGLFPQSVRLGEVRSVVLDALFYGGDYAKCRDFAETLMAQYDPGNPRREQCLHVLGASLYYLKDYAKAQPLLDEYVSAFPEGRFAMASRYFQASNRCGLEDWKKAGELLDAFSNRYPPAADNPFSAYVLYDRACCHAAGNEPDMALAVVDRIATGFPQSEALAMAMNLKAAIHQANGEQSEAEAAYKKAIEIARAFEREDVAKAAQEKLQALEKMPVEKKSSDSKGGPSK
jgi:outer membrane protein assembly factor BamD (BamD/ComL family)